MADSPVAAYIVKQSNGQFKLSGKPYGDGAVRDRDPEGHRARRSRCSPRVKALMANGTYKTILAKWGIQHGRDHEPEDQRRDQLAPRVR